MKSQLKYLTLQKSFPKVRSGPKVKKIVNSPSPFLEEILMAQLCNNMPRIILKNQLYQHHTRYQMILFESIY